MSINIVIISVLDPRGRYPRRTVLCRDIAYYVVCDMPCIAESIPLEFGASWYYSHPKNKDLLYAAFLMARRSFPAFTFDGGEVFSIYVKCETPVDYASILNFAESVISKRVNLPTILPFASHQYKDGEVAAIRSLPAYIDLFHSKQSDIGALIDSVKPGFDFSAYPIRSAFVIGLYNRFALLSRHFHIALHYFVNASRLMSGGFIEEAGLNLNLVIEAIVRDYSIYANIRKTKAGLAKLISKIKLPQGVIPHLKELYDARNEFLAHIDDNMFTPHQRINDPDAYCYEHFKSISIFIRAYTKMRLAELCPKAPEPSLDH